MAHAFCVFLTKEMSTPAMYLSPANGGTGENDSCAFVCCTSLARRVCSLAKSVV